MIVHAEPHLRAGLDQLARVLRQDVAVFPDCVLIEEDVVRTFTDIVHANELLARVDVLDQIGQQVVRHGPRTWARLRLYGADVAVFGQARIGDEVDELVGAVGGHHVRHRHLHDEVRPDVPDAVVVELLRRGHIGHVALRRALIHPRGDRRDLVIAQRRIVLELLDADVPFDVPRRHQAGDNLVLHCPRVRPRIFVGQERHRRHLVRPMAVLTGLLQDRRDVLCECHGLRRRRSGSRGRLRAGHGGRCHHKPGGREHAQHRGTEPQGFPDNLHEPPSLD
jgi:hypothetical protein